ncbi:MAG: bifunctional precorrin-2 dehydrogenase/sirohydrochlorin ferrochelatase [Acidobacteria bacterium]|nr:bifunctional precorrin-2 dehydrogenase/sirohydrochlorin ferrochelatase [Acidobacteriota bacterium]
MRYYPIFLDVRGRRAVVVGGGKVAERKVQSLLHAQAAVNVISPELTPRLALLAAKKKITVSPRAYQEGDLDQALLAFAATDDPSTQQRVHKDAKAAGALVNLADNRRGSGFLVPASFAQGDLLVAISTAGASPALARRLRRQLQATMGNEYRAYLRFMREARRQVKGLIPNQQQRAQVFRRLAAGLGKDWFRAAGASQASSEVRKILKKLGIKTRA